MVVNTVRLAASQFSKINSQSFSDFKLYAAVKTQVTVEKNFSPSLRCELIQLEGNSCSSTSLKKK